MDHPHPLRHRRPPVLDMTPEGEFRDAAAAGDTRGGAAALDRVLARIGGVALLVALAAGGVLLVSLALLFIGLLLPVVVVAGAVGAASLWWRIRRLRRSGGGGRAGASGVRFVVIRPR